MVILWKVLKNVEPNSIDYTRPTLLIWDPPGQYVTVSQNGFPCLKHPDKKLQSVLQDSMWQCFKMDFLVSNTLTRSYSLSSTTACDSVSKWISLSQTPWQEATVCPPRQYVTVFQNGFPCLKHPDKKLQSVLHNSMWQCFKMDFLVSSTWQEAKVCPPEQYVTVFQNGFPCLKHPDKKLQSVLQDSMWQCFKMDFLVSNTLTRSYSLSSTTACDSVSKWISLSQTPWQEATVCPPRQYVTVFQNGFPCLKHPDKKLQSVLHNSMWQCFKMDFLVSSTWQEAKVCPPRQYVTVFQNGFPCLKHPDKKLQSVLPDSMWQCFKMDFLVSNTLTRSYSLSSRTVCDSVSKWISLSQTPWQEVTVCPPGQYVTVFQNGFPCLKHPDKKLQSVLQDSMWQCFKMDFLVSNTLTRSYSLSSRRVCDSVSKWISLSQTPWQEAIVW